MGAQRMRVRYRIKRRTAIKGAAASLLLAVVPGARIAVAQSLDRVAFQTNWRAQAEQGGYYQAVAAGIYRRYGIDCEIRVGGPNLIPSQIMMGGRADACMGEGFQALGYVREHLPFLCVAGICQKTPAILMVHPGVGNDSFAALRGKPILLTRGQGGGTARDNMWGYLSAHFGYTDDQLRPYTASLAPFLADKNVAQQGNISTEPYMAMKAGVQPEVLKVEDLGLGNYSNAIHASRKMAEERPDVLQRFIDASIDGWMQYTKGEDIEGANALIKRDNVDMTDDQIAYARQAWVDNGIVLSGDALRLGIGAMSDQRWEHFAKIVAELGKYPPDFDYRRAYTLQFVNKRVGLT
jgi:NitT/TauT family transport system substrate-binding protein